MTHWGSAFKEKKKMAIVSKKIEKNKKKNHFQQNTIKKSNVN